MYLKYEKACIEANLDISQIRKIRNIFSDDRKKMKEKDRIIEEMHYTRVSIDSEMTDDERSMTFNIPDDSCDVAEEAVYNVGMEKLMRCLDLLDEEEKEIVLKYYDKNSSFSQFARDKGIERTALRRQAETTVIKLKRMMSDKNI